jgi:hypothetical protein
VPIHVFKCNAGHKSEILVPLEHDKWQECPVEVCNLKAYQMLSSPTFHLSWAKADYDVKDPFEGIDSLRDKAGPNPLTYKSDKIFVDQGK